MSAHPGGLSGRKQKGELEIPLDGSRQNSKRKTKDGE
jgi:hypothetical protein